MNRSFLLAGCIAASLSLFACGDDSSSSPTNNVDRDSIESSNSNDEDKSSSSIESSSSEEESSSSAGPTIRAATLDDLEKNMVIKGMFKKDINFSTGSKNGVFSFWLPSESYEAGWVVVHSDFEKGVIDFSKSESSYATTKSGSDVESLVALAGSKDKVAFVVEEDGEDSKLFCVYNGDTLNVETEKVKVKPNTLTSGDSLAGKRLICTSGDTTSTFSFYEGTYMLSQAIGDSESVSEDWNVGFYDIQRNRLLMMTKFMKKSARSLWTLEVSDDYTISTVSGVKTECKAEGFKPAKVDEAKLAAEWDATDEDDIAWTMNLKDDGKFKILANEGFLENREGEWALFGDVLVLRVSGCMDSGCLSVVGTISDFKADKGFKYEHTESYPDDGKDHPTELPSKWSAAQYE